MPADWERLPDEPSKWYARFAVYRDLGPNRTIQEAFLRNTGVRVGASGVRTGGPEGEGESVEGAAPGAKRVSKGPKGGVLGVRPTRHWGIAARRWRWDERAGAWDESIRAEYSLRARRSAERVLEDSWSVYERGQKKLDEFLALPLVRSRTVRTETTPDGKTTIQEIHILPMAGVTASALASLMAEVMRQGRLASGLDVEDLTAYTPEKMEKMTEAELRELREQLARRIASKRGLRVVDGGGGGR